MNILADEATANFETSWMQGGIAGTIATGGTVLAKFGSGSFSFFPPLKTCKLVDYLRFIALCVDSRSTMIRIK